MPGGGMATMQMTLGYDPAKKRYVGTWIGSMMATMWVYDGKLDAAGKVLTLSTTGPDMSRKGKTAKYRDVITIKSKTHRTLSSFMQDFGGAVATHVRMSDFVSIWGAIGAGILVWLGLYLRDPRLRALIPLRQGPTSPR